MRSSALTLLASIATLTMAQTPPNTSPATSANLAVSYGTTKVKPGDTLPITVTSTIPSFNYIPKSSNQTYTLLLVDLSVSTATINASALVPQIQVPLVAGISSGRTTRLHYWQTGLTFGPDGTLKNTTTPIAYYQPPAPPAGDIAHTYVFYLFEQLPGFAPPPAGNPFSQALVNNGLNRLSFNVSRLAGETGIGALAGGNYILVQNTSSSGAASASAGGSARATGTGSGSSATGTGASKPSPVPFKGGASVLQQGLVGVVATALIAGVALMVMA